MLKEVTAIIKSKKLKAKDILQQLSSKGLDVTKSELNSFLYKYENTHFKKNTDFSWEVIATKPKSNPSKNHKNSFEDDPRSNLYRVEGLIESISEPSQGSTNGRKWEKQTLSLRNSENELMFFSVWNNIVSLSQFSVEQPVLITFRIKTKIDKGRVTVYLNAEKILPVK